MLAGSTTLTASSAGLTSDASTFTIVHGAATSLAVGGPASANAGASVSIAVEPQDAAGNTVTGYTGTVQVTSSDPGVVPPADYTFVPADNGHHNFSIAFQTAGQQTVTATDTSVGSITGTSGPVSVGADIASTQTSTITAGAASLTADGTSTTVVTVRLKDTFGNPLGASGGVVALSTTLGTLSAVVDRADGTYTATLTAGTLSGTATITGTLDGSALANTAQVAFQSGPPRVPVTRTPASPAVASDVTVDAQLADANGNAVTEAGHTITWSKTGSGGSFGSPTSTTNASGHAAVTFTTGTVAGTVYTVTADDGTHTGTSPSFTSTPGPATHYSVDSSASAPTAGADVTITAQLSDAHGNDVPSAGRTVTWSKTGNGGSFSSGSSTTNASGRASVTFTTGTVSGVTYTVTGDDGTQSGTSAGFTTVEGGVDGSTSTLTAAAGSLAGNGAATTTVTATVTDSNGNGVPGAVVTLGQAGARSSISPAAGATTNSAGVAQFTVSDSYAEHVTYSATAGATAIVQTADVDFLPDTSISGRPANPSSLAGPTFSFVATSLGVTFECSLDSGAFFTLREPRHLDGPRRGQPLVRRPRRRQRRRRRDSRPLRLDDRPHRAERLDDRARR